MAAASASSAERRAAVFLVTTIAMTFCPFSDPIRCPSGPRQLDSSVVVAHATRLIEPRTPNVRLSIVIIRAPHNHVHAGVGEAGWHLPSSGIMHPAAVDRRASTRACEAGVFGDEPID